MNMATQLTQLATVKEPTEQDVIAGIQKMMFIMRNSFYKEGKRMDKDTLQCYMEGVQAAIEEGSHVGALDTLGFFHNHLQALPKVV